jgi:hypothetical protein
VPADTNDGDRPVSGHALLRKAATAAALRWRFNPAANDIGTRSVRLTFIFRELSYVPKPDESDFTPPTRWHLAGKRRLVLLRLNNTLLTGIIVLGPNHSGYFHSTHEPLFII